MTLGRQK